MRTPTLISATAAITGTDGQGRALFTVTRDSDASTLATGTTQPVFAACKALRAAGENFVSVVTVALPKVGGGHYYESAEVSMGYDAQRCV
jgi:hypothetical protein